MSVPTQGKNIADGLYMKWLRSGKITSKFTLEDLEELTELLSIEIAHGLRLQNSLTKRLDAIEERENELLEQEQAFEKKVCDS